MTGRRWFASRNERAAARVAVAATLVAILPFVVAIVVRAGRHDVPVGDFALMDLRVRDVWSSDIPLVGAYSRFGWNHPGPAVYYAIAPVSGLFGRPAWATVVGNVLAQGLTVAAIALVAWRTGGLARLLASLAFVGLAYGATGPSMVLNAWNPNVAYPLFLLFVLLAWVFATGHPRALIGIALVGSVLVQAHIGYLPLVAAASAAALAFCIAHAGATWSRWRGPVQWSVLGLVLLWLPPVINEFVHPSNVRALARSLTESGEPSLGTRSAARILGEEFELPPPWLGGHHRLEGFGNTVVGASPWWLLVPALLLLGAAVAICFRRRAGSVELLAVTVTLTVVGFVALARVIGDAERYVFYWRAPIALLVVFTFAWCVWLALDLDRFELARRLAGVGLAAIVVVASVTLTIRIIDTPNVSPAEHITRDALAAVDGRVGAASRILVRDADIPLIGIERAIVNEFDRDGVPVKVDEGLGYQFGYSRTARPETVDEVWYVVELGQSLSLLADLPGATVLWNASPLSAAEEAELQAGQRELYAALQDAGRPDLYFRLQSPLVGFALHGIEGVDPATLQRVADLNSKVAESGGCRCAIVAFDPADAAAAAAVLPRPS